MITGVVCLFFVFFLLEDFLLIWRRHYYRWRAANFDLCSALMASEKWGFFNVPHLPWHGPILYNGHLRGTVTLTPVAKRLAVEPSLYLFDDLELSRPGIEPRSPALRGESTGIFILKFPIPLMNNFIKIIVSLFSHYFKHFFKNRVAI